MSDVAMQPLQAPPIIADLTEGLPAQGPVAEAVLAPPAMATWLGVGTALSILAIGCLWMASTSS